MVVQRRQLKNTPSKEPHEKAKDDCADKGHRRAPRASLYASSDGTPTKWKKYVAAHAKGATVKTCPANVQQENAVQRRPMPWKQSMYERPLISSVSISSV
jgi:hypothetical protein